MGNADNKSREVKKERRVSETYSVEEISAALSSFRDFLEKKSVETISENGGMGEDALFASEQAVGVGMAMDALPKMLKLLRKNRRGSDTGNRP